jgi:DNA-binding transcriptional ArsR family regulator
MSTPLHDAFRRRGLGPTAGLIWRLVGETPGITAAELDSKVGLHRSTVYRNLSRLREAGLVYPDEGRWFPVPRDLDDVARELGVDGSLARQRQNHARQRKTFGQTRALLDEQGSSA